MPPSRHRERHALQHEDHVVVDDLDAVDVEQRLRLRSSPSERRARSPSAHRWARHLRSSFAQSRGVMLLLRRVLRRATPRPSAARASSRPRIQSEMSSTSRRPRCWMRAGADALVVARRRVLSGGISPSTPSALSALVVDVQVLEAPAHLLAGHRLPLPNFACADADRLDGEHRRRACRGCRAPSRLASCPRGCPCPCRTRTCRMSLCTGSRARRVLSAGRVVALGAVAGGHHVGLGARPPHAVHLLARIADRRPPP